jgi:hypothetical protein
MQTTLKAYVLINNNFDIPRLVVVLAVDLAAAFLILGNEEDDFCLDEDGEFDVEQFKAWRDRFEVVDSDVALVRGVLVNSELAP